MDELLHLTDTRLGSAVTGCNDEFFGTAAAMLRPEAPSRRPGVYTDRGAWVDGWETRRRREPGFDWCVVRLGVPGQVRRVVVDTTHFSGNQPEACWVEGCGNDLPTEQTGWFEVVPRAPLQPDHVHTFQTERLERVTFLRLCVEPDGGVARFRAYGSPVPAPREVSGGVAELASPRLGAQIVGCSDAHFSSAEHLLLPDAPTSMGDGWETRRRRGPGHDWVVVRLGTRGAVQAVEVDTTFFKGNAPASCWVDARDGEDDPWHGLVHESPLRPHAPHWFDIDDHAPVTHVRLSIAPDGGVARLRVQGRPAEDAAETLALRWLHTLPAEVAEDAFRSTCASRRWAAEMTASRPYASAADLRRLARERWQRLEQKDWLEAFAAHPRIGDRVTTGDTRSEQAGMREATPAVRGALSESTRAYEKKFGHVFLIRAAGRSAEEILAALRERLANDADTEMRNAAQQQEEITDLRLGRMLGLWSA